MRIPNLYDFVYLSKYGKSLFQVIGVSHSPTDKYPKFCLLNTPTLKSAELLCNLYADIDEIYGVPFSDLEFHFPENTAWGYDYGDDDEFDNSDKYVYSKDQYIFSIEGSNWKILLDDCEPEPTDIEYIHELQQYHRGVYGNELDVFGGFIPS